MKRINQTICILLTSCTIFFAQTPKNVFPVWTYHTEDKNIYGVSFGIGTLPVHKRHVNTNGIKVELIGVGILIPIIPESPIKEGPLNKLSEDEISEHINGIALSLSGTACDCVTNGISVGYVAQINYEINGLSASLAMNFVQISNGVQLSMINQSHFMNGLQLGAGNYCVECSGAQIALGNDSKQTKGLQIGLYNRSKHLKGFQIGLWNVNQKRKLPLINWAFS